MSLDHVKSSSEVDKYPLRCRPVMGRCRRFRKVSFGKTVTRRYRVPQRSKVFIGQDCSFRRETRKNVFRGETRA